MTTATNNLKQALDGYAEPDQERPLAAYAGLTATFGLSMAAAAAGLRAAGKQLPERPAVTDMIIAGIATHKISRLLAKDKVTAFARGPFTRFQDTAGHGEVEEEPRGRGARYALGELLVCPYCLAQWISAGYAVGLVAAPRQTRFVGAIYVAQTLSDFLQLAYKAAEDRA
jgi:hypothetical protein